MKDEERPLANPNILLREEFDDWAVLFDPDTGQGFGLNPTGVHLWRLMDGEHSVDSLCQSLCVYSSVTESPDDHVVAFVEALVERGLATQERCKRDPDKFPHCASEISSKVQQLSYEPPRLVNLNSEKTAFGANCTNGSHATSTCSTGNGAISSCSSGTGGSSCSTGCGLGNGCHTGAGYGPGPCGCTFGTQALGVEGCNSGTWPCSGCCNSGTHPTICGSGGNPCC